MRFDDILGELGSFGPYQRRVYLVVCLMAASTAFHSMTQVFIAGTTDHWCKTDYWDANCSEWNLSPTDCKEAKKNGSIPVSYGDDGELVYDQCYMYNITGIEFDPSYDPSMNGTASTIPCQDGWEHDKSQLKSSIIQDWDLVCDKKHLPDYAQSVFYSGYLFGSIFFGVLADKIGRYPTLFICLGIQAGFGVLVAFSPNFWVYNVLRFFQAAGNKSVVQVAFIIGIEFVTPKWRTVTGITIHIFVALGYMTLATITYFVRYWRTLQLLISGPLFLFFLLMPFIPESARWLLSHGNGEKAEKIIRKVAKVNKRKLPDPLFTEDEIQKLEVVSMVPKASIFDLFRTPVLRWRTINFIYNWMVNNIVYYGLTYSSGDLGFNVHLNFFLSGAVEIVGYVLAIFTIDFFGRRPSIATFLIIGGCSCLINIGLPIGTWNTVVALTGKSAISASYTIVYVYSAECFPTPVRSIGIGICSMMARVGTIVSPMILILGDYYYPAPLIIFGTTAITAGFLSFFFPETRGMRLPETIEEGETLGTKAKDDNSAGL
ncbi:organic cation transporter protein [Strongylocentrotus purpuratus]|uniref:Major facilitator superfamily (MFS) profile domain-containing protein n=1 Tax=Strongylocentrotus purpuratus TaxID=7668 RepID=A0A7M7PH41_STRPU|nr:organic cation transporter protein [Strongylocentrotus purpuratus]